MSGLNSRASGEDVRPSSASSIVQFTRGAPLVIVSERGRHSDESRRIVRSQAARASAAQSRVTRARNREERESTVRDEPSSPQPSESTPAVESMMQDEPTDTPTEVVSNPLVRWLTESLNMSITGLLDNVQALATVPSSSITSTFSTVRGVGSAFGSFATVANPATDSGRPQLPLAIPRGFATLQQRIQISDNLLVLVSRTSCFDFGSQGVEERLHQLIFDLILNHARAALSPLASPGHAIQGHLRVACTCLTIFQGQRADGMAFAYDQKYRTGLEAAWSEATLLDQNALAEPKSAEASLWAVFIISVTTGATTSFFHQLLRGLCEDLQLRYWSQVRQILLDFIYPVSFLDEPCKSFFEKFQRLQIGFV
ncbi:hypothetical protein LTR37_008746 [Vermiconidia calcicola]|uniref:Uncharacterized protein n=1 Tax=Vermiconidia calcicola TaxID=1690605 RepID=A0ACC3N9U0_9PEZI|nr:hypothetical protein LTR37_008746 [Vermiconidia calcicola]